MQYIWQIDLFVERKSITKVLISIFKWYHFTLKDINFVKTNLKQKMTKRKKKLVNLHVSTEVTKPETCMMDVTILHTSCLQKQKHGLWKKLLTIWTCAFLKQPAKA